MKKKLIALLAGALMTVSMAGNALAYFGDLSLTRVIYNKNTMTEVATDLVKLISDNNSYINIDSAAKGVITNGAGETFKQILGPGINLSMLGTTNFADLKVAYFAKSQTAKDLWVTAGNTVTPLNTAQWSSSSSAIGKTESRYSGLGGQTVTLAMTDANSYWMNPNSNGLKIGRFGGMFNTSIGEASLAALATTGYVDQYLYFYDNATSATPAGSKVVKLRTLTTNGSDIVTATPIPPAFLLMGSGLLGLVGIRRKSSK